MTARAVMMAFLFVAPLAAGALPRAAARQDDGGKALYDKNCMQCHGVRGLPPKGMKTAYPKIPTFDAAFIAPRSDDSITKVLTRGKNSMPAFKARLTPDQMATLATYVHGLASK